MQLALGIALLVFFALMVGISLWSRQRVHSGEDFIVAGRRLSPLLTLATIMATWYAAETILVTADEVRVEGLRVTGLEPIGIALCLMMGGLFYARRLWETQFLTLADVIGSRFGAIAERIQALLSITYVGWVAVQLLGLAGIFQVFFGLPVVWGVVLITVVLTLYTLIGGMWSVALTDIVQLALLLFGVVALTLTVLNVLGGDPIAGLLALGQRTEAVNLVVVPLESADEFKYWLGLIVVGMFGNLATQDLVQRMFAARSAQASANACIGAGVLYLLFGTLPVILGLAADLLLDASVSEAVIPALAEAFFSPFMAVLFALTLTAAVTSSVDSGLLAPASALARNVLMPLSEGRGNLLALTRWCVVGIAVLSAAIAVSDVGAFELLQGTYAIGIPAFVLLTFALYQKQTRHLAGVVTLALSVGLWLFEITVGLVADGTTGEVFTPAFPAVLLVFSLGVYIITDRFAKVFDLGRSSPSNIDSVP
jgi:Na+/proline symporter